MSAVSLVALLVNHPRSFCNLESQSVSDSASLRGKDGPQDPGLPVLEDALGAYATIECESPRLIANPHDITLDGHIVESDVEWSLRFVRVDIEAPYA